MEPSKCIVIEEHTPSQKRDGINPSPTVRRARVYPLPLNNTEALNSVAGLPATYLSSGIALNLKYTPDDGDEEKMLKHSALLGKTE